MSDTEISLMGEVETIAFATDGSESSDGALQETIFLAQACGAKVIIINVTAIDTEVATAAHSSALLPEETKAYIDNAEKMAKDSGIECQVVYDKSYQPDKSIVQQAIKHKADVIIMGRHGSRGLLKHLVGSMTAKVIGHGFPHVLVVPSDCTIAGDKILLATDGSSCSERAVEEALSMANRCSTLREVHVVGVSTNQDGLATMENKVKFICDGANGQIKKDATFYPLAVVGRPSEMIVKTAKEKEVDMIIVGGHGKGLTKLLMGHVTEKVIGRAHCAVLVVEKD